MVEKRLKCTMSQDALNFRLLAQQFYSSVHTDMKTLSASFPHHHSRALVRELAADLAVVRLPRFSNATNPPSFLRGERTCLLTELGGRARQKVHLYGIAFLPTGHALSRPSSPPPPSRPKPADGNWGGRSVSSSPLHDATTLLYALRMVGK